MIARTAKHNINERLRSKMKELKIALQRPYITVVIDYLNLLLGQSPDSSNYWNTVLKGQISKNYPNGLSKYSE